MLKDIVNILESGTGLGVEFANTLFVHQLEDGRFRVMYEEQDEWIFDDATKAALCFLTERKKRQLGYDFEKGA